jgi:hypothetical protein
MLSYYTKVHTHFLGKKVIWLKISIKQAYIEAGSKAATLEITFIVGQANKQTDGIQNDIQLSTERLYWQKTDYWGRQIGRQTGRQSGRQTGREIDRVADKETDRQRTLESKTK